MTKVQFIAFIVVLALIAAFTAPIVVNGACRIIYGGGLKKDGTSYCAENDAKQTPTPQPTQNAAQAIQQQAQMLSQTKGGLPIDSQPMQPAQQPQTKGGMVYAPSTAKQIPNTGPELLGLIGLIPAGVTGFFLRKKTQA